MRSSALVVALAACSTRHEPAPAAGSGSGHGGGSASAPVATKAPEPARIAPLELPAAGVAKLVVHPAVDPASHIIAEWNAKDRSATIVCRVEAYNLVAFDPHDPDGLAPGAHQLEWRPDPFVSAPKAGVSIRPSVSAAIFRRRSAPSTSTRTTSRARR